MIPVFIALGAIALHNAFTPKGQRDGVMIDYQKGNIPRDKAIELMDKISDREMDLIASADTVHNLTGELAEAFRQGLTPREIDEAARTGNMDHDQAQYMKDAYYHTRW